jgi:hypothetical protein
LTSSDSQSLKVSLFSVAQMNKEELILKRSNAKDKKYALVVKSKDGRQKTVNFGCSGMQDYTQHKDAERKEHYISRHKHDPTKYDTAGELSRTVLWSAPSLN